MERKDVYTQVLEYNFPKERQSMIVLQVLRRIVRGKEFMRFTHTTVFG